MFDRAKLFFKSTRFKNAIWYSLIFLILEIVIGLVIFLYLRNSLYEQLDLSLTKQCELIYHFVSEKSIDLYEFRPDSIYSSPDELVYDLAFEAVALNPNNTFIQVRFKDKIVFQTENLRGYHTNLIDTSSQNRLIKTFSDIKLSPHEMRAAVLNENGYQIITAFPVVLINDALKSLTDLYIIIAPIFFFISVIGGAFISIKSLSRIDSIIDRTKYITARNLDEKISGDEFKDEYGRLAKTMNEMITRIKKSIDYMNQFSISAAHELKTPLTILRGEIELALRSKITPDEYREVLQSNLDETLRLINIVDKLFFISKTDHALIKINKEKTELNNFIFSAIESMKKIANEKNIKLNYFNDEKIDAEIDTGLINQVIYNLIENAIKFSDVGQTVEIRLHKTNSDKAIISFTNKGEYIPPELHKNIFERFFRIESSRNRSTGGAGLGLSVVKSIVEMHGGEIEVASTVDGLTTFTIKL
ncbi:MAG: ATP-binding protein [Ignavibacteriaceae bacterium]|nr:ATP-binding protein [Ignavibacteriaceae bacterium]MCW9066321.1 ATP-binding protein [Ignavibacteriaceae bacterium]